jgi:Concanavalin A-like lectin/glucanases superfamily
MIGVAGDAVSASCSPVPFVLRPDPAMKRLLFLNRACGRRQAQSPLPRPLMPLRRRVAGWLGLALSCGAVLLSGGWAWAQVESVSREWSLFLAAEESTAVAAVSREWSLFLPESTAVPVAEAISREWSLFLPPDAPTEGREAISREFSLRLPENDDDLARPEAISREWSLFLPADETPALGKAEAISREMSLLVPDPRPRPEGLIGWWRGEGDALDSIGDNHGTLRNGSGFETGFVQQGFDLDGVDQDVLLGLPVGGGPEMTVSAWIHPDRLTGDIQAIFSASGNQVCHLQFYNNGNVTVYTDTGAILLPMIPESVVGGWHHVLLSVRSGATRLYLDGEVLGDSDHVFGSVLSSSDVRIGSGYLGSRFFAGQIDEVMLFDRALDPTEVRTILDAGASGLDERVPVDLAVLRIDPPSAVAAGNPVQLTWSVTNASPYILSGKRWDSLWLSSDGQVGSDLLLGWVEVTNGIAARGTREYSASVLLPSGVSGPRWVVVGLDAGGGLLEPGALSNNVAISVEPMVVSAADLRVASVVATPDAARFGDRVEVSWRVENQGSSVVQGAWRDRVFLRQSGGAGEWLLGTKEEAGVVEPGAGYDRTLGLELPFEAGLLTDGWQLVVRTDVGNAIPEALEDNNERPVSVNLAYPPLPDLEVSAVTTPVRLDPGEVVAVTWAVTNRSATPVAGEWREVVRWRREGSEPLFLAAFPFGGLAGDSGTVRNVLVTVPLELVAGSGRIEVEIDVDGAVVESALENNIDESEVVSVSATLGWRVAKERLGESAGASVAVLTRNGPTDQSLEVTLASSDPGELTLPSVVVIPAGRAAANVSLTPVVDRTVDADAPVRITAGAAGYRPAEAVLVVVNEDRPHLTIELARTNLVEGERLNATVRREGGTTQALSVVLGTSLESDVSVPRRVEIPAGATEATFEVVAIQNRRFEATRSRVLQATAVGFEGSALTLVVTDDDPVSLQVETDPHVLEGGRFTISVHRTIPGGEVPQTELRVRVDAPAGGWASARDLVFQEGISTVQMEVLALDDTLINGGRPVEVRAQAYFDGTSQLAGFPVSTFVQVSDNDVPALSLRVEPGAVREELASAALGRVSRNGDTNVALMVRLQAEDAAVVQLPATVVIPRGAVSAEFAIHTGSVPPGRTTVGLAAFVEGYTEGRAALVVADADLPDITVAAVLLNPTTQVTDGLVNVGLRIANLGTKGYRGGSSYRIWLSEDDLLGNDRLVAAGVVPGFDRELSRGAEFSLTVPVFLGTAPGVYRVIAEVDVDQRLVELDERNNARLSDTPLTVVPEYTALVTTTVDTVVSGESVPLRGVVTLDPILGGGPAPRGKPVSIHVQNRGASRVFTAFTDATGAFALDFQPLPGEAGQYRVGATHPGAVLTETTDGFAVLDVVLQPRAMELSVIDGAVVDVGMNLFNPGESALTGLTLVAEDVPPNLTIETAVPDTGLTAGSRMSVPVRIRADGVAPARAEFVLRVSTSEGVVRRMPVSVTVEPKRARLVVEPGSVETGVVRGETRVVNLRVRNVGGAPSGPVTLTLPAIEWMRPTVTEALPAMEPGEAREFGLVLAPPSGVALTDFGGQFRIDDGEVGTTVPFRIRTISRAVGDLRIRAVDEVTFFDPSAPPVTNATVTVRDALSRALVTNGVTDGNGIFVARELPEAPYEVEVEATRHNPSRSSLLLVPGITNEIRAFLTRQTVTYRWTVVPTEIEDRTVLRVEANFDAVVPLPVIELVPQYLDLAPLPDGRDPRMIQMLLTNRGLVKAENLRFEFPTNNPAEPDRKPGWLVQPLVWDFQELKAGGSYSLPLYLVRQLPRDQIPCELSGRLLWDLRIPQSDGTVQTNTYTVPIPIINAGRECEPQRIELVTSLGGGGGGGASRLESVSAVVSQFTPLQAQDVPARISLRLGQTAVLTREAFRAMLEVGNQTGERLEQIGVRLSVRTESGADAEAMFAVQPPTLDGLTGIDGAGILGASSSGSAEWILVPTTDAAGSEPVVYRVSGELTYRHEGNLLTVPLAEVAITVHPSPRLVVQYFHERFVYSDDPFTAGVREPAIPYVLGMLVKNEGFGRARNLRIRSGTPQIIRNDQGLLIDFNILATQVNGRNAEPSLLADFGDIEAGATTSARWFLNSSLQGYFSGFTATFEHLDAVSGKALSLFDRVEIYALTRSIRDPRPGMFGQMGFLARTEVTNGPAQPLRMYLADGSVAPVVELGPSSRPVAPTSGRLEVTLSVNRGAGWNYHRLVDPEVSTGPKRFRVVAVRRPDGSELPTDNFWETDREFPGRFVRPLPENRLHIVDYDPPAQYTLVYQEVSSATDRVAPSSRVASLPEVSGTEFTVRWAGEDNAAGELRYDVYVAVDGGAFERWLTDVSRTSAIYVAQPGRNYRFYSRATDAAGNIEETPALADAGTTSSQVNTAPRLGSVADVDIPEGAVLNVALSAMDDDVPSQALRYAVVRGPAGMTVDQFSGVLRWETREVHGPSTNEVVVRVQDAGSPPLSEEASFQVVVREVNRAPEVTPTEPVAAVEGRRMQVPFEVTDADVPANAIRFRLASGAPAGVRVDPVSGVLEWTPGEVQGGREYRIGVVVSDNGDPVAESTVWVDVTVRDTRSDFRVDLGRTNLVAGAVGSLPLRASSVVDLDRLDLHIDVESLSLSDFQLLARSTRVRSVLLQPEGLGMRATLTLGGNSGNGLNDVLAEITFASDRGRSESAWLRVLDVRGVDLEGAVLRGQGFPGRVFVVGREPLVDLVGEGAVGIDVYGLPGRRYVVESAATMDAVTWTEEATVVLGVGESRRRVSITPGAEARFYRAKE